MLWQSNRCSGEYPSFSGGQYSLSCRLAEEYPDRAIAWFAVGCYYLCAGQFESARRFFGKATALDASFAPAWLGFGHAFAAQDESDQARSPAAYHKP